MKPEAFESIDGRLGLFDVVVLEGEIDGRLLFCAFEGVVPALPNRFGVLLLLFAGLLGPRAGFGGLTDVRVLRLVDFVFFRGSSLLWALLACEPDVAFSF